MSATSDQRFIAFVDERSADLLRMARQLTGSADDGGDLVQAALERAYRHWERIDDGQDPFGYVRRTMVNLQLDGYRRATRGRRVEQLQRTDLMRRPCGGDPAEDWRRHRVVAQLLDHLSPRERAVVVLRCLEDLSEADTAVELGMAVGTVKSTMHRALGKLRGAATLEEAR